MKFRFERVWCNTCLTRSHSLTFGLPNKGIWVGLTNDWGRIAIYIRQLCRVKLVCNVEVVVTKHVRCVCIIDPDRRRMS